MANKSSLPLGMAVVSPSKHSYSSLRNRIYYNTHTKRNGSSNTKSNGARNTENRNNSVGKSQSDLLTSFGKESGSSHNQKKVDLNYESGVENRQSSRLLRQRHRNPTENGNGMKRKAETELVGSKPPKARLNVQASSTSVGSQTTKKNSSRSQKKITLNEPGSTIYVNDTMESNNTAVPPENLEKSECDEIEQANPLHDDGGGGVEEECSTPHSVKHVLFPPDHENNESNVFSNDQADYHVVGDNEHPHNIEENDTVTGFFGSLGLERKCNSDKDDASIFTDSGASTSSSELLFPQQETTDDLLKDDLDNKNELDSNNGEMMEKEGIESKHSPLTPAKKSARISAKRAILEKNSHNYNDENTIWSIWGGLPPQKQQHNRKMSLSEDGLQLNPEEDNVINMSPDSMSSSELSLAHDINKTQVASNKGPRIKQTPVRVKKLASPAVQPEKQVSVGNVVWGKVHGHPWWPGRVLAVSGNIGEGNEVTQHAHVTWFGSNTSSIMPVNELQHFLANFSRRFKKAKKGCYRKAVKQAQDMLQIMEEI